MHLKYEPSTKQVRFQVLPASTQKIKTVIMDTYTPPLHLKLETRNPKLETLNPTPSTLSHTP